jgi:hypothetical protein
MTDVLIHSFDCHILCALSGQLSVALIMLKIARLSRAIKEAVMHRSMQKSNLVLVFVIGFVVLLLFFFTPFVVSSQPPDNPACPDMVSQVVSVVSNNCADLARNEACYGNVTLIAEPFPNLGDFAFSAPGDIVGVHHIQHLQLSTMDSDTPEWGMALLKLQANLPDTMPGQNVSMVLFGDIDITNRVLPAPPTIAMQATAGVNVRQRPVDGNVLLSLSNGQDVVANGRLEDSSWVRIELTDASCVHGWVSADFLRTDDDISDLSVMAPSAPTYGAMQAFYFTSGIGDAQCQEAPDSGILLQTPSGTGEIQFVINEVTINLGSTAFLTAEPNNQLVVNVVEGEGEVIAQNSSQAVPAGTYVTVPLTDGIASGVPSEPIPYDNGRMNVLPISLLDESITIHPALTETEIEAYLASLNALPESVALLGTGNIMIYPDTVFGCGDVAPVGQLPPGTVVPLWAGPRFACGVNWYQMTTPCGITGWVKAEHVGLP